MLGKHSLGGEDARFGARRPGHRHQGQDITADEGTPVVAPRGGTITWRAFQRKGAGYYLVLEAVTEPYNYVFMHLQKGSLQATVGDRVRTGQVLGGGRQHRLVVGAAPALRDLARPLVQGRRADRPAAVPRGLGRSLLALADNGAVPSLLLLERVDRVALVTLNRPEKRNALSIELRFEVAEAFDELGADDGVACVVLTGAGPAFCSGMDTTQFGGDAATASGWSSRAPPPSARSGAFRSR